MSDVARQIEQLRANRVKPGRDTSISALINSTARSAQRTHKKLGELIDLWETHVPAPLANQTAITGLRAGTLHVAVADAAARFELDRLLREGLEQTLRLAYRGTLVRVRLKVSPGEVASEPQIR